MIFIYFYLFILWIELKLKKPSPRDKLSRNSGTVSPRESFRTHLLYKRQDAWLQWWFAGFPTIKRSHKAMNKTITRCLQVGLVQLLQGSYAGKHWFHRSFSGQGFHGVSWCYMGTADIHWDSSRDMTSVTSAFIQILSSCLPQAQALRVEHEALREAEQSSAELDAFEAVMRSVHDGWAVLLSWWSCHCPGSSEWVKSVKNQQNWRHFLMWLRRACNVQEQRQRHVLLAQQKTQQQEIQAIKRHAVSYKQTNVRALAGS